MCVLSLCAPPCVLPRVRSARVDSSMCSPRMYTLSCVLFAVCTLGYAYSVCTILCVCSPYLLLRGCSPRMYSHPCVLLRVWSLRVYPRSVLSSVCTSPCVLSSCVLSRCVLFFSRIHSPPRVFYFVYIFLCLIFLLYVPSSMWTPLHVYTPLCVFLFPRVYSPQCVILSMCNIPPCVHFPRVYIPLCVFSSVCNSSMCSSFSFILTLFICLCHRACHYTTFSLPLCLM